MAKEKVFTWGDLGKFIAKLPKKELQKPIVWWGDERGGKINGAWRLEEDYGNPSGEGMEPRSVYEQEEGYNEEEFEVDYEKGTPILNVD